MANSSILIFYHTDVSGIILSFSASPYYAMNLMWVAIFSIA